MDYLSMVDYAPTLGCMAMRWRINELLEDRGWTAYRLAKESGMSPSAIYKLRKKTDVRFVEASTLEALADAFGLKGKRIWSLLEYVPDTPAKRR